MSHLTRTLPTAEQMADSVARLCMLLMDLAHEVHPDDHKHLFDRYGDCLGIFDLMKDNG